MRVKLLSERLLAFRDSDGNYGLIDEFCAHRGVSLWFGRNEHGGIRCPYHGWKYDHTGQCIEVPSEPAESGYCSKIKLKSYPLIELGDVLWTYMGPNENQPPHPEWEFALVPPEQTFTSKRWQQCNWLQAMEGGIDSSHVSWLHSGSLDSDPLFKGARGNKYNQNDKRPFFEVVDAEGGLYIGARRNAEEGFYYWRITPWVMPSFTMVPPRGDHPVHGHFWIPIDDENCWAWSFDYHPVRALSGEERQAMKDGKGIHVSYEPGLKYGPAANKDNDYLMDREAQRKGVTYSGVEGIAMQDDFPAGKHGADYRSHEGEPRLDRQRHHHGAPPADQGGQGAEGQGCPPARYRPEAPPHPLSGNRAARRPGLQRTPRQMRSSPSRARRRCRYSSQSTQKASTVQLNLSESARATTAEESRYRIDYPNSLPRVSRIIALDRGSRNALSAIKDKPWNGARFLRYVKSCPGSATLPKLPVDADLEDTEGNRFKLSDEINDADIIVMVTTVGSAPEAAEVIGNACLVRGKRASGLVLMEGDAANLSQTLLSLDPMRRCWSSRAAKNTSSKCSLR